MTTLTISSQAIAEIDQWIQRYPSDQRQSAVLAALRIVQDENKGYLTTELMDWVADYLHMPKISVYEVASFYKMFELSPVGKHKINVCNSISCFLRGSDDLIAHLQKRLGIHVGETTADGKFTLKKVECLAACIKAPACQIGKQYYENLTPELIDKILDELS